MRPRLPADSHRPLRPDGDRQRRPQMAHHESRPREGPDRLPGTDTPLATAEGALPHRRIHEAGGAADSHATPPAQRHAARLAGHLFPRTHQLYRLPAPLLRRAGGQCGGVGDGTHSRTAPRSLVSHHRTAQGHGTERRTMVRHQERPCGEHCLREPRLRP